MRWDKAALGFLFGLLYAAAYLFLAFGAAGAGHGTGIFFAAILPYGLGLLAFPIIGFFVGDLRPFLSKVFFVCAVVVHYTLVINFLRIDWLSEAAYFEKMWNYSPVSIVLPTAFYVFGQLTIWIMFIREFVVHSPRTAEQALGADSP